MIATYNLVKNAVDELEKGFGDISERKFAEPSTSPGIFLRTDFESHEDDHHIEALLFALIRDNLTHLIVNGDTTSSDPLLKSMDGEVKRGELLDSISIEFAYYERNYKHYLKAYQHHIGLRVNAQFGRET